MHAARDTKQNAVLLMLLLSLFCAFVYARVPQLVSAATISTSPYWKEIAPISGYYSYQSCSGGGESGDPTCSTICQPITLTSFSSELFYGGFVGGTTGGGTSLYIDSSCTTLSPSSASIPWHNKTAVCGPGEVMVGARDYEWQNKVDDEHVDAYCAAISGATVGAPSMVSAPNATVTLWGGYKEADCPAGQVMTATNMYGYYPYVDDEHIDAGCSSFSGTLGTAPYWVVASNAFSVLNGGYKQAVCSPGDVMIGVRYYEYNQWLDDEHTDVLCATLPQPTVNVHF